MGGAWIDSQLDAEDLMTIIDILADLEAKAKQATPGPWKFSGDDINHQSHLENPELDRWILAHEGMKWPVSPEDKVYIAACSPDRILALVAYVQTLGRVVEIAENWRSAFLADDHEAEADILTGQLMPALEALEGYLDAGANRAKIQKR